MLLRSRPAMGTFFELCLAGRDAEHLAAVADAALDEVARVERLLSRFDPRSEVARLNRHARAAPVLVDREVAAILARCVAAWRETEGWFDIAATSGRTLADVVLDAAARRVWFAHDDVRLDLGGFGKGYALDRAAKILAEFGVADYLMHGGSSSVVARGSAPDGGPWRIALGEPAEASLADEALSCSRPRRVAGETSDIVDPRTGRPLEGTLGCAVIAPTAAEAEILSTTLVAMGAERARRHALVPGIRVVWLS